VIFAPSFPVFVPSFRIFAPASLSALAKRGMAKARLGNTAGILPNEIVHRDGPKGFAPAPSPGYPSRIPVAMGRGG